jgi:hypothetical protein
MRAMASRSDLSFDAAAAGDRMNPEARDGDGEGHKFKFNERKAVQAAGRLILQNGEMNYMALIKLLYLIDRESLLRFGRSITGDKVVAMKQGPVWPIFDGSRKKQQLPDVLGTISFPGPHLTSLRFGSGRAPARCRKRKWR